MDWQGILETALKVLVASAPIWIPVLIAWLKRQKIIRTKEQEELAGKIIPGVIDAVEAWAKKQDAKPEGSAKLAKAQEIVAKRAPILKDADDIVDRIEAELFKRNGG
jgi:hypothetical protein